MNTTSLRIVPQTAHPTSTTPTPGAPSAPGVPDTLRTNLGLAAPSSLLPNKPTDPAAATATAAGAAAPQSSHPLEPRLRAWRATQDALRGELLRRQFGVGEPVRRGMEGATVRAGEWRPACLGGSAGVHADVLAGRDADVDWEDVFGKDGVAERGADFHREMEVRSKMVW
ncbi:proteasome maturation factor UMP1-domain-containing protein [Lineolata rhizophorae]|uniref:Proteasome maturation factor UMP1-domain-containing protein n=1 Tax=Lineolata rhizophorae TaxID=578093 RepID=A0A6A6PAW2_9PEZI|nr:proteasome maturation factor UMP1-domain-containing protein [Lineolata rhizophorae]